MVQNGVVMSKLKEWSNNNFLTYTDRLYTSQYASNFFKKLDKSKCFGFKNAWFERNLIDGVYYFDSTSVSSRQQSLARVEFGYNRDHDLLPQINLGMLYCYGVNVPVYYIIYNGSLNDESNLPYMLEIMELLDISKLDMYLDGGFAVAKCFEALTKCHTFSVGMPLKLNATKEYIDKCKANIESCSNFLWDYNVYCVSMNATVFGISGRMLVFFDPIKKAAEFISNIHAISKKELELLEDVKYTDNMAQKFKIFST
jgi:transposase